MIIPIINCVLLFLAAYILFGCATESGNESDLPGLFVFGALGHRLFCDGDRCRGGCKVVELQGSGNDPRS